MLQLWKWIILFFPPLLLLFYYTKLILCLLLSLSMLIDTSINPNFMRVVNFVCVYNYVCVCVYIYIYINIYIYIYKWIMPFYKYVKNYFTIMEVNNFSPSLMLTVGSWAQNHTMGRGVLAESVVVRVRGRISPRTS